MKTKPPRIDPEPPAGGSGRAAYPLRRAHASTPAHPPTCTLHTVDINPPRFSSFGKNCFARRRTIFLSFRIYRPSKDNYLDFTLASPSQSRTCRDPFSANFLLQFLTGLRLQRNISHSEVADPCARFAAVICFNGRPLPAAFPRRTSATEDYILIIWGLLGSG